MNPDITATPPQSVEFESAVLGAIILQSNSFFEICNIIKPEVFYKQEHQIIYKTIISLFEQSKKVDLLLIVNELKKNNELELVGGAYYLTELTNHVANTANIVLYAQTIVEKFILRELIRKSNEIQEIAYSGDTDAFDLLDQSLTDINLITDFLTDNNSRSARQIVKEIYETKNNQQSELKSRFNCVYNLFPYCNSDVIIFAGRPGHGKTVLAVNEACHFSETDPFLYFSLEMQRSKLIKRICSDKASITNRRIQRNNIYLDEQEKYDKAMGYCEKLNLFINDKPRLTISQIHLIAKKMKYQYGIKGIIIDHFHLIRIKGRDKNTEYAENSQMLKVIAKDLDLPVICLFQLNRDIEKRSKTDIKARMSDLREVGEQDADIICFLTQPDLLGVHELSDGTSTAGKMILSIAKNRDGVPGDDIILGFNGDYQRIYEIETEYINRTTPEY